MSEHNRDPMTVQLGDIIQYVWGMPGPDFSEGPVTAIHDDGTFDAELDAGTPFHQIIERKRLSDRNGRVTIGYVAKVTRPGVNGF